MSKNELTLLEKRLASIESSISERDQREQTAAAASAEVVEPEPEPEPEPAKPPPAAQSQSIFRRRAAPSQIPTREFYAQQRAEAARAREISVADAIDVICRWLETTHSTPMSLFRKFDKDSSNSLDTKELAEGLQQLMGAPCWRLGFVRTGY